jgi:alpha-tubulin suppressor-like RCC1 family protein
MTFRPIFRKSIKRTLFLGGSLILALTGFGLFGPPGPLAKPTHITTGNSALVLRADGTVWSFGYNNWGQLGYPTDKSQLGILAKKKPGLIASIQRRLGLKVQRPRIRDTSPHQVPGLNGIVAISAGEDHSVTLNDDGSVWTFGSNIYGQLGNTDLAGANGTIANFSLTPTRVAGLTNITAIAASNHTVALKIDGTVFTFGNNVMGALGRATDNDDFKSTATPTQVPLLRNVIAIAAARYNTVVLKTDGTVWTFGSNEAGQLGYSTENQWWGELPRQVPGLNRITAVAAGANHTIALRQDGTVWTFGSNESGQLGRSTEGDRDLHPAKVPGLVHVTAIAAGIQQTITLKNDGTVWAFGSNGFGQLGTESPMPVKTPKQISGVTNAVAIAAHGWNTAILKQDGTIWTLGYNANRQLGYPTDNSEFNPLPKQVPGM